MVRSRVLQSMAFAACLAACGANGLDWPQFKGDAARTGDAPGEELAFPLSRVLALRFPAPLYASPAAGGGKVYAVDARGHVVCAAAAGNKVLWTSKIEGVTNRSSPAVQDGRVYIGSSAGHLVILDAADGKLRKTVAADGAVLAAPALANGHVYFCSMNGTLYKVSRDGDVVWTYEPETKSSFCEIAVRGDRVLYVAGALLCLQDEGKTVKKLPFDGGRFGLVVTSGICFGTDETCALEGFAHEWGGRVVVKLAGGLPVRTKELVDSRGTPAYRGGRYYWGGVCYEADAPKRTGGARAAWSAGEEIVYPGASHASPVLAAKHLVLGTETGRVHFLPLEGDEKDRKPAWTFKTEGADGPNGAVSCAPALCGGRVYFGGEDGILYGLGPGKEVPVADAFPTETYALERPGAKLRGHEWPTAGGDLGFSCVSPETELKPPLKLKWKTRVWSSVKGPMIVADGKVFRAGRLSDVEALDAESGEIVWRAHHADAEARPAPTYADGKLLVLRGAVNGLSGFAGTRYKPQGGGGIWCHDAATGKLLWRKELPLGYHYNADGLAVDGKRVLACWNAGEGAVEVAALNLGDGSEAWRKRFEGLIDRERDALFRCPAVFGDGRFYLSVPAAVPHGKKKVEPSPGATLALDPETGEVQWRSATLAVYGRMRIAFRKGVLTVFGEGGGHALDAATGKELWTGALCAGDPKGSTGYLQPLTDVYLDSRGTKGIAESHYCSYAVYANGVWYGHLRKDLVGCMLDANAAPGKDGKCVRDVDKQVWKQEFTGAACPTPSPAYGRLYYSPNEEGVVYCFEPEAAQQP